MKRSTCRGSVRACNTPGISTSAVPPRGQAPVLRRLQTRQTPAGTQLPFYQMWGPCTVQGPSCYMPHNNCGLFFLALSGFSDLCLQFPNGCPPPALPSADLDPGNRQPALPGASSSPHVCPLSSETQAPPHSPALPPLQATVCLQEQLSATSGQGWTLKEKHPFRDRQIRVSFLVWE